MIPVFQRRIAPMTESFGDALRRARLNKHLSQKQLAKLLYVDRSSIANWEAGRRMPDANMISQLSECLSIDVTALLTPEKNTIEKPTVILVDDEKIILKGSIPVLRQVMPNASIFGFSNPDEALDFAKKQRVHIAFLDIELGRVSGLELSKELLRINPSTNIIYLTAFQNYAYEAWLTGASGFLLKPINTDLLREILKYLRNPVSGLSH